ncbi:MAG: SDR family oxidoreductase [Bryobacteraceae bacterium]|nr:SDR family oxidoreductase [Bryobacteraceae bacterium]
MSRLRDKVALIAGGAGQVGEGIVREFLREGATVIVPSRSRERLALLPDSPKVRTVVSDISSLAGAEAVRNRIIDEFGRLDSVVASIGSWWQGPQLIDVPLTEWAKVMDDRLTSHFVAARTFLPVLRGTPGSSYTMLNGGAAETPVPHSGPVSIMAAAQLMMKDVLVVEQRDNSVRINTLLIQAYVITRDHPAGDRNQLTADHVGAYCAYLASGEAASIHGQTIRLRSPEQLP